MSTSATVKHSIAASASDGTSPAKNPLAMKLYKGIRSGDGVTVTVEGKPLDPCFDLWPYNYDGFDWGHPGSGAQQFYD